MSSVEKYLVQRVIRRADYALMLLAGVKGMLEEDLADLRKVDADDDAARAQSVEKRWGVPAQRKAGQS